MSNRNSSSAKAQNKNTMSSSTRTGSRQQSSLRDIDTSLAITYVQDLEENIHKVEDMMRELAGGLTQIKSRIPELRDSLEHKQKHELVSAEQTLKKLVEAEENIKLLEKVKNRLENQLENIQQHVVKKDKDIEELHSKLKKTEQDLRSTQTRLSEVMGNKLIDSNPEIADLSDQNRPSKLAEKYAELYDNEWTDAFEAIQRIKRCEDEECVATLLRLLDRCKMASVAKWNRYTSTFRHEIQGRQDFQIPDYVNKQLKDIAKSFAPKMVDAFFQEFLQDFTKNVQDFDKRRMITSEPVKAYLEACFEICWLMAAQDPPVVFNTDYKYKDKMDTNIFKAYTQNGDEIEFLVWPPLFLYEGGALLTKGVAQGVKRRRPESAPAPSRSHRSGADKRSSPTSTPIPGYVWNVNSEKTPVTKQPQTNNQMEVDITPQSPRGVQENQSYQQATVNAGLQENSWLSPTNTSSQPPVITSGNMHFGHQQLPVTDMVQNNQGFQNTLAWNNQHTSQFPLTNAQQQPQLGYMQWNYSRWPTTEELNKFNRCIITNSEDIFKKRYGEDIFQMCRDYCKYREGKLMAGGFNG